MAGLPVPSLRSTLSHASPDKAEQIRSAVTGTLKYAPNGLFCFERTVETTFVLPWDLNPQVQPQKLSIGVRDGIRSELLDAAGLAHLESSGSINWNSTVVWQCRGQGAGEWVNIDSTIAGQLEAGYHSAPAQWAFMAGFTNFQVDYDGHRLLNTTTTALFDVRRLAFAPLMPMKTEQDQHSLFHAASLGFWGVHDRTALLSQAVTHTLGDPKAQFLFYDRWSTEVARLSPLGAKTEFPQWEAAKQNLAGAPQLHLFTLANVVQRPIIVYTHPDSPIGGIYLPLLWQSAAGQFLCEMHPHLRNPLVLGYNATCNHFSPLVTFKGSRGPDPILLPLAFANGHLLRLHFLSQPEETQANQDSAQFLSKLMLVDVIAHTQGFQLASQVLQVHTAFGGSTAPQFGPSSPVAVSPLFPPTLAAISTATELPEVMDTLIKRYESLFL